MPKMVSEIAQGTQYQFSGSPEGVGASLTRVFRILLESPQEYVNLSQACEIAIGDAHPTDPYLRCTNYVGQYDGESRMVILATFTFTADVAWGGDGGGSSGGGRLSTNPEIRPANWGVSSSMIEVPAYSWSEVTDAAGDFLPPRPAANPVGDMYEGVTRLEPVVTISIEQFEMVDPTRHVMHVGKTNRNTLKIGSLDCPRRTVMLRSVQSRPVVEQYGSLIYRGWNVSYEFTFRRNKVSGLRLGEKDNEEADIGWDIAIPQTGLNIRNDEAALGGGVHEVGSLLLEHQNYKIKDWPDDPSLAAGTGGRKVRGMILVHSYEDGGASQMPCAQPIPLNDDGTPRSSTASPKVIVKRYKVTEELDFKTVLGLRLN
jgi:hypothetical protein